MFESVNSMLDQFQLAEVPSLPPLILRGLKLRNQHDSGKALAELLALDVSLSIKIFGSSHQRGLSTPFDPATVLTVVGEDRVQALISQAAMQSCLSQMSQERLGFFRKHWLESCISSALSTELAKKLNIKNYQEAGFCARFLNLGELVLENLYCEQYRDIHGKASTEAELFKEEIQQFGCSHAELSASLFERWGLHGFTCDALRYHDQPLEKILDASNLVKICWLANMMANPAQDGEGPKKEALAASEKLFNLKPGELNEVYIKAQEQLQKNAAELNEDEESVQAEILELMQNISLYNAVRPNFTLPLRRSASRLNGNDLGETLSLLFGIKDAVVFHKDVKTSLLKARFTGFPRNRAAELEIECEENRSLVAKSYLSGKKTLGIECDSNMTVVDRQLLSALGTSTMVCDPLVSNNGVVGVLVLGVEQSQSQLYSKQSNLLDILKSELATALIEESLEGNSDQELMYQQRINDAIHEVNNPLSIIKNYLQLLSIKQAGEESVLEDINIIKSEIDRVRGILKNLKNDDAANDLPSEVQINSILEGLLQVFMASIFSEKKISISLDLDSEMPLIFSKENELKQMFTNILKNAAEALSDNGRIIIKTSGNIYMNQTHYVQVLISDNGPGIPSKAMDTLFLPGNSTKGGSHTGAGLAISRKLIENMDGQISCQSNNTGTSFTLLFPKIKNKG